MRIKSYFSGTVEAAISLARRELGEEAVLISSRPSPSQGPPFEMYEVVFGYELNQSNGEPAESNDDLQAFLTSRDVSAALARHIQASIPSAEATDEEVRDVIERSIQTKLPDPRANALAFVGPPGGGKTSSLIKVAVRERSRPVRILALESERPGVHRGLQSLAAMAGISCRIVDARELAESFTPDALYLIDTAGFGPKESKEARFAAEAIRKIPAVETQLVVTATARSADLVLTAERFQMFQPNRALFTRFDEASTPGAIVSLAYATGLPVSWLGTGQSLPDDLVAADSRELAAAVLMSELHHASPVHRVAAGTGR